MQRTTPAIEESGFYESEGLRIHYRAFGEAGGTPLVLVHGLGVGLEFHWVLPGWTGVLARTATSLRSTGAATAEATSLIGRSSTATASWPATS